MRRTSGPDHVPNLFGAGKHGYKNDEPGVSAATVFDAACINSIQEELARAVEGEGLVLNPADSTQLSQAMHLAARHEIDSGEQIDTNLLLGYAIERAALGNLRAGSVLAGFVPLAACETLFGGQSSMMLAGQAAGVAGVVNGAGSVFGALSATLMPSAANPSLALGLAFDGSQLACVGGTTSSYQIWTSGTGGTFTSRLTAASSGPLNGICMHNGTFVAVGTAGRVYTSSGGVTWTPSTAAADATLRGVASDGTRLVAVGNKNPLAPVAAIYTSDNGGASWQERQVELGVTSSQRLNGVVWTGTHWIAVGHGGLINISEDGTSWLQVSASGYTGEWQSVAKMGQYSVMAVGTGGELRTALTTGSSWRRVSKLALTSTNFETLTSLSRLTAVCPLSAYSRGIVAGVTTPGGVGTAFYTGHW